MTTPILPDDIASKLKFHVKHEAIADLKIVRNHLEVQNAVMNLIGPATLPEYWSRHVLDSAQLLDHRPDALTWADLGAGAGFPGIVLAILLKHSLRPGVHVYLIDSLAKRCRFLSLLVKELDLPATVIHDRAENVDLRVDVVTARACAPMTKLLGFAEGFINNGADAWFLKGEKVEEELQEAGKSWRFDVSMSESISDPRGRVIHIQRLSRVR